MGKAVLLAGLGLVAIAAFAVHGAAAASPSTPPAPLGRFLVPGGIYTIAFTGPLSNATTLARLASLGWMNVSLVLMLGPPPAKGEATWQGTATWIGGSLDIASDGPDLFFSKLDFVRMS